MRLLCLSRSLSCAFTLALLSLLAPAARAQTAPLTPDIPSHFSVPTAGYDYVKREVMIPMRDGVKLHTVIVIPKGATHAPMLLTRTPYDASGRVARIESPHLLSELPQGDEVFVQAGYIRIFQDVRGKYGSEGSYVMTRPLRGPLNNSPVDHSTDAYDSIDGAGGDILCQQIDGASEEAGVTEDGGDVLELDAGFWKVRHVANGPGEFGGGHGVVRHGDILYCCRCS